MNNPRSDGGFSFRGRNPTADIFQEEPKMSPRLSARSYAAAIGVHEDTVQAWCRNSMLPEAERNAALPPVVARRLGKAWSIHVARTDQAQSLMCGNPTEKGLVKKGVIL